MSTSYSVPVREHVQAGYRVTQPQPVIPCDCAGAGTYCGPQTDLAFFVTAVDGPRVAFVAGPYRTHLDAVSVFHGVCREAERLDPRATWYSFGTARARKDQKSVLGALFFGA
jgi:hypothetical protein